MSYKRIDPFVYGDTERFKRLARQLLEKYGKVCVEAVKELRDETDYPMTVCHDVLLSERHDMRMAQLETENAKLRELVRDYIDAPCTTCDCWQDEFRCWNYDGADCGLVARARELGVEVD